MRYRVEIETIVTQNEFGEVRFEKVTNLDNGLTRYFKNELNIKIGYRTSNQITKDEFETAKNIS